MQYIESLRNKLFDVLKCREDCILIGEDISDPYGGAFKVTKGISSELPDKVIQTPISESGFIGVASGLAYMGYNPIVEIMFADFLTLATDVLINSTSKFEWLSQGQMKGTLTIRTPAGGRRGYGPIHSQSIEKLFYGWPGIEVIAPNIVCEPGQIFVQTIEKKTSVKLFIENKSDYSVKLLDDNYLSEKGFTKKTFGNILPTVVIENCYADENSDVTICCYGGMVSYTIDAAFQLLIENEITCTICVLSQVFPTDIETISMFVNKTNNLVIVEESYSEAGWGSYIISDLAGKGKVDLSLSSIKKVGAAFTPIPADPVRERKNLPELIKSLVR